MNFEMPEIFVACEDGDLEQVTELLDGAPDLIGQKFSEDQPLHLACWQKHSEVVALLVDRGADVNAPGDGGKTPLHYAVCEGD